MVTFFRLVGIQCHNRVACFRFAAGILFSGNFQTVIGTYNCETGEAALTLYSPDAVIVTSLLSPAALNDSSFTSEARVFSEDLNAGDVPGIQNHHFLTERDVRIGFHQQLEEIKFTGVGDLIDLDHVLIVLQVDCGEPVTVRIRRNRGWLQSDHPAGLPVSR